MTMLHYSYRALPIGAHVQPARLHAGAKGSARPLPERARRAHARLSAQKARAGEPWHAARAGAVACVNI
ncbi:hypothetical protein T492DRAFT_206594 [Pavlovales sp. CCMP2436]|nr:hypothetical protein T492DRAFT_206594 [Pavlovales sp. CCMP2436]